LGRYSKGRKAMKTEAELEELCQELLSALRDLLEIFLDQDYRVPGRVTKANNARAAIAKAEGSN